MDFQYSCRCEIRYLARHNTERYKLNRQLIQKGFEILVSEGEQKITILDKENFKVFHFAFSSKATSWLINLEIYDSEVSYETIKPVYMNGIFSTYKPYVTTVDEETLRQLNVMWLLN
jgi:hypothetical protein